MTRAAAAAIGAAVASVALVGCGGVDPPDPVGRFEFDAQASIDASKSLLVERLGGQGAGVVEMALGQLSGALRASEMHFELAADGTLTGHRRQLNPVNSVYLDREENGSWLRIEGGETEATVALELSIVDAQDPEFVETRAAVVDEAGLRVTTPMGAGPVTFVYLRVD
ncbi:hypothetical protein [Planctomycetes bacterium Pla163]|uniref:hypothetical protein n=1 Tax=Rohdeia mirabilis TaxID=2528008 RepID=UPI0011A0B2ED